MADPTMERDSRNAFDCITTRGSCTKAGPLARVNWMIQPGKLTHVDE